MQLASHGARVAARIAGNLSSKPQAGGSTRSIHTSSAARNLHPPPNLHPTSGTTQRLVQQTRNFISRFATHLTAPGTLKPSIQPVARSVHGAASGRAGIQNSLSFPVRTALSRPLQGPFLPRPPMVPRTTTQVGLGTVRNFSSSRPIFQNLVENVPIAGRAFWEADWEVKMREERAKMMKKPKQEKKRTERSKEMSKPRNENIVSSQTTSEQSSYEAELQHYFPVTASPEVTTYLLVPLAPTPTSRTPLPPTVPDHTNTSLLPLNTLASLHADYGTQSLRIHALWSRLDEAQVWKRGVSCTSYTHGRANTRGSQNGVCTVLKIEFSGWTASEVRSVIGESGSGWCVLEEVRSSKDASADAWETSSAMSEILDEVEHSTRSAPTPSIIDETVDPAQSFILPTLDFSSSFVAASSPPSFSGSTPSDLFYLNSNNSDSDFDFFSDEAGSEFSSNESAVWIDPPPAPAAPSVDATSSGFGFGFSSDFVSRLGSSSGSEIDPKENLFY